ncbi:hypothetical protein BGZ73_002742 [Actinomortierella ambigua]|nr:hypothetical protein BGZ73_002742 [Actinomortierella ambigua]
MLHRGTSGRVARGGRNDLYASPASELSEHVRPAITRRVSSSPSLPPPKSVPPKPDVAVTSWLLPKPNPRQDSANSPPSINTHVEPSKDMATLAKARASRRMDMTLLTKRLLNLHRLESVCSTERLQDLFTPSSPPTIAHRGGLEEQPNSSTMEDPSSSSSSSSTTAPSLLLRPKEGKTRDCQLWSLELQNTLSNLSFTDCVLPPTEYPWSVAARRVHREDDENERYGGGDGDEEVGPEQYVHGHGEQDNSETLHPHHHHHHHRHQSHSSPPPWISPVVPARRTLVDEEHEHILTLDWLHRLQRLPPSLLELYPGVKREIQKLTIQV